VLGWVPRQPDLVAIVGSAWAWRRGHPAGYEA
jgi:UDP-glucose 4-epimerase